MKIILGKQIEEIKKKDSENKKNLLKNRNSEDINELDDDDVFFHSNTIKNIKLGNNTVNRIYLNNSIVYELEDTIDLNLFHSLVPSETATSIIFDKLENQDISNFNLIGYCDANYHIAVYNNNTEYLILNIRNAINYAPQNCNRLFGLYRNLTNCIFNNFNTKNVTNMSYMFLFCDTLTSLDVSNFNTDKVTTMRNMFSNCNSLTSLDVSNFNTDKVTDMRGIFQICSSLTSLDISNFNTDNATEMAGLFSYCSNLTSLDVSNFNTDKVTDMRLMFNECIRLKTIISNTFSVLSSTNSYQMFSNCTQLIGGNGTTYDANYINAEYARIDGENGLPGYFTAPANK